MKKIISIIKQNYKLFAGALITGIFLGWLFFHSSDKVSLVNQETESHEGHSHESEIPTIWTCSMHP